MNRGDESFEGKREKRTTGFRPPFTSHFTPPQAMVNTAIDWMKRPDDGRENRGRRQTSPLPLVELAGTESHEQKRPTIANFRRTAATSAVAMVPTNDRSD